MAYTVVDVPPCGGFATNELLVRQLRRPRLLQTPRRSMFSPATASLGSDDLSFACSHPGHRSRRQFPSLSITPVNRALSTALFSFQPTTPPSAFCHFYRSISRVNVQTTLTHSYSMTESGSAQIEQVVGYVSLGYPFGWAASVLFGRHHEAILRSKKPKLFVMGTKDGFTSVKQLQNKLKSSTGRTETHLLDGVGHFQMEGPVYDALMVNLIFDFIQTLQPQNWTILTETRFSPECVCFHRERILSSDIDFLPECIFCWGVRFLPGRSFFHPGMSFAPGHSFFARACVFRPNACFSPERTIFARARVFYPGVFYRLSCIFCPRVRFSPRRKIFARTSTLYSKTVVIT
ncbi:hypothetical protein KSP40_PGU022711 [Platanthera guangdongensis]|uniref:Uncharacterized protein n=1 Tax=Platanthera guangdongensis TaxID=2320717 RepID=A0ABR2LZQ3_9ASPA